MTTSQTVVKIEYDPRVSNTVLDLTQIINDVLPKALEYDEDIRIDITHRIDSENADPKLILKTDRLDLSKTRVEVVLHPSTSHWRDVMTDQTMISNRMDSKIKLMISGYRFKFFVSSEISHPLLVDRAHDVTDIEIVFESEKSIKIGQKDGDKLNTSSCLTLNRNAYDLLKGTKNIIRSLEHLHDSVATKIKPRNSIRMTTASLVAGRLNSIDRSRIRVDSDLVFNSCVIYAGVIASVIKTIHNTDVTINGNIEFNDARISGVLAGYSENLSDSSLKVRGNILLTRVGSNVIGLMVGTVFEISGEIRVDIRERITIDSNNDKRQIGIVAGMIRISPDLPYSTYAEPNPMLYNLTFLENTFKRKSIESSNQIFGDIGTFTNADVDNAINSMIDFSSNIPIRVNRKETQESNGSGITDTADTAEIEETDESIIKGIVEDKTDLTYRSDHDKSVESYGGIFRPDSHVRTETTKRAKTYERKRERKYDVDHADPEVKKETADTTEITDIIEATRRAIRDNKIKKQKKSSSKTRSKQGSNRVKLKKNKKTRYSNRTRRSTSKRAYSPELDTYPKEELLDRKSDDMVFNFHNPLPRSRSIEEQEEEIFKSLAVKRSIDDRRLSKERQAVENRLGRLKKSLRTF
jgi:hypothetical protein